ncbi:MAG: CehA/McbA family metallohydrolase [Gammaproteobacteria bacterium]
MKTALFGLILFFLTLLLIPPASAHNEHPLGRQQIPWTPNSKILRTLAYNFDFAGGGDFVTWRPPGGIEKRGVRECLVGPYFFFDVSDDFAFDIDETVTIRLLFDLTTTEGFNLSYDHAVKPSVVSRTFDQSNERWHWETVTLERARFANRKYAKTDFAVGGLKSLFPADNTGGGHQIALCDMQISRSRNTPAHPAPGNIKLKIADQNGDAISARVGIYDATGRSPLADRSAVSVHRFGEQIRDINLRRVPPTWPTEGRYVFYVDGNYQASIPPGRYTVVVSKGPEYRLHVQTIEVSAQKPGDFEITLQRWINMPAKGWYSGDDHIHIARNAPDVNRSILSFTSAEDIHLSNLLQMANVTTWHFPQYAFGAPGHFSRRDHALAPGQESPRTSHRGHTIGLNAPRFHWPERDYFLYDKTADAIHEDGGMFGYAHVAIDGFNVSWGLALDVPLGIVDFLEMLQMGVLNTEYFYDFLNLGYKLLPSAGSDYPYIHIAGAERVYVNVGETFTIPAWFDAWRTKRSFVSNAPIIDFAVNGDRLATEFNVASGDSISVSATSRVNPDFDQLENVELVVHGNVVATATGTLEDGLELEHTLQADESFWFVLRTLGANGAVAHTAPVYVFVDNDKQFWNKEIAEQTALKYIDTLNTMKNSTPDLNEEWERFNVENDVLPKWEQAKPGLDIQINEAIERYKSKINSAQGKTQPLQ